MPTQHIADFSGGLNTLTDARRLKPNSEKETTAESPDMENVEITKTGSLITSTGFEVVSSIASTGGPKALLNYEKDETNRYLIITHDDDHYSITPTVSTWSTTNLGDYGTVANYVGGTVYLGAGGDRLAILGNDIAANTTQEADLSAAMQSVAGAPPDGYIMETFMGRLFVAGAGTATLYYTNVDDEDDWAGGGTIGFNDIITGLAVEGERLIVFTRTYHQGVHFVYDDTAVISVPQKEPYERQFGCLAHKSVQKVYPDVYYWSNYGVMRLGAESAYDDRGIPRPQSLSTYIDPSLEYTNKTYRKGACSVFHPAEQQYYLAVPYGTDQFNSRVLVYNRNWDAWTTRSGVYPTDFALFKNSDYKDELYFTDYFASRLLKFNDGYSYAGAGYPRRWKSKKFTMGDASRMKIWKWIDITGSMYESTEIKIRIQVDNAYKEYKITNTELEKNAFGEYMGDNWKGDAFLGGEEADESAFKRFRSRLYFIQDLREGFDMQLTIYNSDDEEPWKIDSIAIEYDYLPRTQLPSKYINNNPIP